MSGNPGGLIGRSAPIAVVGAGTIGAGIAQVAAVAGYPVTVYDAVEGAAERAVAAVRERVARLAARGRLDGDAAELSLAVATELGELASAQCVIEAVVEDLAVKQALFATWRRSSPPAACWPPTLRRCRPPPSPPRSPTPGAWWECISSIPRR